MGPWSVGEKSGSDAGTPSQNKNSGVCVQEGCVASGPWWGLGLTLACGASTQQTLAIWAGFPERVPRN